MPKTEKESNCGTILVVAYINIDQWCSYHTRASIRKTTAMNLKLYLASSYGFERQLQNHLKEVGSIFYEKTIRNEVCV